MPASLSATRREEALAEPRGVEGGDELLVDRAVGLARPARGTTRSRGTRCASPGLWPASRIDEDPARFLVPGAGCRGRGRRRGSGARTPWRSGGGASSRRSGVSVAALSSSKSAGGELPGARRFSGRASKRRGLGDGVDEVVEPLGQVADRGRVVDHRRRDLVGLGLALGVGLHLVEPLELARR